MSLSLSLSLLPCTPSLLLIIKSPFRLSSPYHFKWMGKEFQLPALLSSWRWTSKWMRSPFLWCWASSPPSLCSSHCAQAAVHLYWSAEQAALSWAYGLAGAAHREPHSEESHPLLAYLRPPEEDAGCPAAAAAASPRSLQTLPSDMFFTDPRPC